MTRRHWVFLILILLGLAAVFFFFYHSSHNDRKAIEAFAASYDKLNKAISVFSASQTADLESLALADLVELKTKAVFGLSSLTKNDAELMGQAREIADLFRREMDSLRVWKKASLNKSPDADILAKECDAMFAKRRAAWSRFQQLAGLEN